MPTPVGHTLAGALIYLNFSFEKSERIKFFLIVTILALLPDVDLLFGFFDGNPNKYHHQFTHSLFFVLASGLMASMLFMKTKQGLCKIILLFVLSGLFHLVLDLFAVDTHQPQGVPLFWPFLNRYFISPWSIFPDVHRAENSSIFFQSLFNRHNAYTVFIEVALLGPMVYWVYRLKRRRVVNK
jgi:inner membrane protein